MSLQTEFTEILGELTKFQSAIGRVHQGLRSTKEREILGDLLSKITQARSDAETAVPVAIQKIRDVAQDVQKRAEEQQKKLAELQQQIEERKKNPPQPPAPPAKPEIQFDPNLGAKLCQELMQRVAPASSATDEKPTQVIKEIWEDWNWDNYGKN
jgi:polyhydroxyalkanoate synthesis regulator phasin